MNLLYDTHKWLLQKLIDKKVDFILIGGYAVNYYGYNRVTGDMDIWIKPDNDNKKLLLEALQSDFDDEGLRVIDSWDFTRPQFFHIGNKPDLTDFLTFIAGVEYETSKQNAVFANIEGINLYIIHFNNLIENKKATGRLKDLADVEYLQKIFHLKNAQ